MKKLGLFLVAIMAVFCFTSCGGHEGTVKSCLKAIKKQDFDKAVQYCKLDKDVDASKVADYMRESYKGDDELVDFSILGSQEITKDEYKVAYAYETKGGKHPKGIVIVTVKKVNGDWKIEY